MLLFPNWITKAEKLLFMWKALLKGQLVAMTSAISNR